MLFNRAKPRRKSREVVPFALPAPSKGLIRRGTPHLGDPQGAEVLNNFLPTDKGVRMRGGATKYATAGAAVEALLTYHSGSSEMLFAATETDIYPITTVVDPDVAPAADVAALTSSDWSQTQMATAGGEFLVIANGADSVRNFDGTNWTTPVITGATSADFTYVWHHKKRLWFAETSTNWAWYLATNSIAGAATAFPLHGIFRKGGYLLFGTTFSADLGSGPDDLQCFVSSEGEVAVYQGIDPGSDFAIVGLYDLGSKPLHKNAHFRLGGDVMVFTEAGIISLAVAMGQDPGLLKLASLTDPIQEVWQEAMERKVATDRFAHAHLTDENLLFIAMPHDSEDNHLTLVANTTTGAWATISGWDADCWAEHINDLYYGDPASLVAKADTGGADLGVPYTGQYASMFLDFGNPNFKSVDGAQLLWRGADGSEPTVGAFVDYNRDDMLPGGPVGTAEGFVWGSFTWGSFVWGQRDDVTRAFRRWFTIHAGGLSMALTLTLTSEETAAPEFYILGALIHFEPGALL